MKVIRKCKSLGGYIRYDISNEEKFNYYKNSNKYNQKRLKLTSRKKIKNTIKTIKKIISKI